MLRPLMADDGVCVSECVCADFVTKIVSDFFIVNETITFVKFTAKDHVNVLSLLYLS